MPPIAAQQARRRNGGIFDRRHGRRWIVASVRGIDLEQIERAPFRVVHAALHFSAAAYLATYGLIGFCTWP